MSAGEATYVGQELCRALAAVHQANLLHRDIKAQNVMRASDGGRIILMDFGAGEFQNVPTAGRPHGSADLPRAGTVARCSATIRATSYTLGVLLSSWSLGDFQSKAGRSAELASWLMHNVLVITWRCAAGPTRRICHYRRTRNRCRSCTSFSIRRRFPRRLGGTRGHQDRRHDVAPPLMRRLRRRLALSSPSSALWSWPSRDPCRLRPESSHAVSSPLNVRSHPSMSIRSLRAAPTDYLKVGV